MARVLKKNSLRTRLETPDVFDKDDQGNVVYPATADGSAGDAYTYNADHFGEPPPAQEVEEPDDDDENLKEIAAAAALALGAKRHKENLKKAADAQHGRLRDATKEEGKRLDAAAKLTHKQRQTDAEAARKRLGAAAYDAQTTGMAAMVVPQAIADSEPGRENSYEDFTNMPLVSQENAGGTVIDAPTGNDYAVASGPLPSGVEEGAHSAMEADPHMGEHVHEGLTIAARHARQQARGAANQAQARRQKALGQIAERKEKGLPTESLEREAGWAHQQEQRARGMEQENARIEIGQRYREMEDIGAERQKEQGKAGADLAAKLEREAQHARDMEKETLERKAQGAPSMQKTTKEPEMQQQQERQPQQQLEAAFSLMHAQPQRMNEVRQKLPPERDAYEVSAPRQRGALQHAIQKDGELDILTTGAAVTAGTTVGDVPIVDDTIAPELQGSVFDPGTDPDLASKLPYDPPGAYDPSYGMPAHGVAAGFAKDDSWHDSPPLQPDGSQGNEPAQTNETSATELQLAMLDAARKKEDKLVPDAPEPPAPAPQ